MASCGTSEAFFQINQKKLKYLLTTTAPCAIITLVESRDSQLRVCWNRQTGTFEGRVSLTYGFKSRHSHQKDKSQKWLYKAVSGVFFFLPQTCLFWIFPIFFRLCLKMSDFKPFSRCSPIGKLKFFRFFKRFFR